MAKHFPHVVHTLSFLSVVGRRQVEPCRTFALPNGLKMDHGVKFLTPLKADREDELEFRV
jgi:hypothetical protein